jgi:hypothetical protein
MPNYYEELRQYLAEFKQWLEEDPYEKNKADNWEDFFELFDEGDGNEATARFESIFLHGGRTQRGFSSLSPRYSDNRAVLLRWKINVKDRKVIKSQKEIIERIEREKQDITNESQQWKTKLQTFINQRKTQLQQEIQLIKEVLHE